MSNVGKSYVKDGKEFIAVSDVSFDIAAGELVSLVGPSGCGKTTVLKILAGLLEHSQGEVSIGSAENPFAPGRDVGMVFQQALLLKWRNDPRQRPAAGGNPRPAARRKRGAGARAAGHGRLAGLRSALSL